MRTLLWATLVFLFLVPAKASAECEKITTVAELNTASRLGEEAFGNLDSDGLLTQSSLVRTQILPCLQEVIPRRSIAAFHRLMALEAFINGNESRVVSELHASLALEPGYVFPQTVAGPGHPLLGLYQKAETSLDGEAEKTYPPPKGYMLVGGVRNAARYSEIPVIIQAFDANGILLETRYIQPKEASPNWSGNAFGLTLGSLIHLNARAFYMTSLVGVIASSAFYALAMSQKSRYLDPATSDEERGSLETRVNRLGTTSAVLGGVSLASGGFGVMLQIKFGSPASKNLKKRKELANGR